MRFLKFVDDRQGLDYLHPVWINADLVTSVAVVETDQCWFAGIYQGGDRASFFYAKDNVEAWRIADWITNRLADAPDGAYLPTSFAFIEREL